MLHTVLTVSYTHPLVGAWIEIEIPPTYKRFVPVAPLVGAWIEIIK